MTRVDDQFARFIEALLSTIMVDDSEEDALKVATGLGLEPIEGTKETVEAAVEGSRAILDPADGLIGTEQGLLSFSTRVEDLL